VSVGPITFAIPYYSGLAYLEATLASVLAQTDSEWIAVVCDDSPTAEARETVERAGRGRVRYAPNERTLGMAANFNRCIDIAETDLVTVLHADDRLAPAYTEEVRDAASRHPDAAAIYCGIDVIGADGHPAFSLPHAIKRRLDPAFRHEAVLDGEPGVRALLRGNFIPAASLCLRKSKLGTRRFVARYRFVLDWDLTLGMLLDGHPLVGLPAHLLQNRAHAEATTEKLTRSHSRFTEEIELYREMADIARGRGWDRCVAVAEHRYLTKLHVLYRALRGLARLDLADARHGWQLLRTGSR
jgi:glycosyltransferase involved in cell wall biosynthesis